MILVPAALSLIWRSSWNLFQDCSASELQHSHSFPIIFYFLKWSVNTVKTSGCIFQTLISLRRSKYWLLSCLQNQVDFPSKVLVAEDFSPSLPLTLKRVVWEGVLRKKCLWPFHILFWSLGVSAKICLENFLFPSIISCGIHNGQ